MSALCRNGEREEIREADRKIKQKQTYRKQEIQLKRVKISVLLQAQSNYNLQTRALVANRRRNATDRQ